VLVLRLQEGGVLSENLDGWRTVAYHEGGKLGQLMIKGPLSRVIVNPVRVSLLLYTGLTFNRSSIWGMGSEPHP